MIVRAGERLRRVPKVALQPYMHVRRRQSSELELITHGDLTAKFLLRLVILSPDIFRTLIIGLLKHFHAGFHIVIREQQMSRHPQFPGMYNFNFLLNSSTDIMVSMP